MKPVHWRELRDVCLLCGWVESRMKGDHLVMTKPGMARPVVIKMVRDLGSDLVLTNLHTMGISRKEFDQLLARVRGRRR